VSLPHIVLFILSQRTEEHSCTKWWWSTWSSRTFHSHIRCVTTTTESRSLFKPRELGREEKRRDETRRGSDGPSLPTRVQERSSKHSRNVVGVHASQKWAGTRGNQRRITKWVITAAAKEYKAEPWSETSSLYRIKTDRYLPTIRSKLCRREQKRQYKKKKLFEDLIAYFPFTLIWVSDTILERKSLYVCLLKSIKQYNLWDSSVEVTDGSGLWSTWLRWPQMAWYTYKI
jgi:hypothetical protein